MGGNTAGIKGVGNLGSLQASANKDKEALFKQVDDQLEVNSSADAIYIVILFSIDLFAFRNSTKPY